MANDKQSDPKKNFSSSFIFILMAAVLLALMVQGFMETKTANVAFSYQLEHLVNLELIKPEESKKTALNDNLVTFSGKFRNQLTEEGKQRYKYLSLLNENHKLKRQKEQIFKELNQLQERIYEAAVRFLQLTGKKIPSNGYVVIDEVYNIPERKNSIVITSQPKPITNNLPSVEKKLQKLLQTSTLSKEALDNLGISLANLIDQFQSPLLGIGSEPMKQTLRQIDRAVQKANRTNMSSQERVKTYQQALSQLKTIANELDNEENHVRLAELRSVRNYKKAITDYETLVVNLEDNEIQLEKARKAVADVIWFFNNKEISTRTLEKQDPEVYQHWFANAEAEWKAFEKNKGGYFKAPDQHLNLILEKKFKSQEIAPSYLTHLFTFLPILLIILVLYFIFSRQMKGVGSSAMNFGKSPAKLLQKGQTKVTFKDVAGIDEAKEELIEIVDFLKDPHKFTALGGRIPKGVLCVGPPGCGKTLIAKAVAGEANRPFFSISGSDFVEMFVGVGASRIRDMFEQAKKHAPCIIFIDEIDAVGRHRGAGIGGGHDEREQTLNQLLVEMDGFDSNEGIIIMAATNRPDVLDKALLRPGRFDRRIMINLPDIKGRFEILKVHARKIKIDASVDLMNLARSTPGTSGADLENILNEAALLAARKKRSAVTEGDILEARDKVLYGKERRSLELDEEEKMTTAYHESGHTVCGLLVEHSDPIDKVTIIPRGFSLGATLFTPKKNRVSYWKKELLDQLIVLMGGRAAEELFVRDISSGAQQDIERATHLARSMVCEWGMSDKLGPVAYEEKSSESSQYLGVGAGHEKKYSEETARAIDAEVRKILDEAHNQALKLIKKHKKEVELMTRMLIEFETLDSTDIKEIMEGTWDIEKKKKRLKEAEEKFKTPKSQPPPPPKKRKKKGPEENISGTPSTAAI